MSKESASRDSELDLEAIIAEFSECEDSDHGASSAPAVAAPHPESPRKDNEAEPEHRKPSGTQKLPPARKDSVPGKTKPRKIVSAAAVLGKTILTLVSIAASVLLLIGLGLTSGSKSGTAQSKTGDVAIMDKFDMFMTNKISTAVEDFMVIEKVYWLSDNDEVAPKPNQDRFGTASSPKDVMWLLEEAADLIDGRELTFNENVPLWEHGQIHYYYDETILVIFWQQLMDGIVHNVAEVIVADASQFRRGLAGGEFGSDKQFVPSQIAQSVNAVVATSGDFYKFRQNNGIIVHKGELKRFEGKFLDTCFIDDKGDLLFVKRGEMTTAEEAEKYIKDHNVRFSLAFGPVMVEDGKNVVPGSYAIGEITGNYTRASVCQKGELHYMFISTSSYMDYGLTQRQTLRQFADNLIELGAEKAYALDGGQTTIIAINGQLVTSPDYEEERQISDIIYFATALPNGD